MNNEKKYPQNLFWVKDFKNQFEEYNEASVLYSSMFMYIHDGLKFDYEKIVEIKFMKKILFRISELGYEIMADAKKHEIIAGIRLYLRSIFDAEELGFIEHLILKHIPDRNKIERDSVDCDDSVDYDYNVEDPGDNYNTDHVMDMLIQLNKEWD